MTYIYFMKNHSKLFSHFIAFYAKKYDKVNIYVGISCSDHAKQYFYDIFQYYMVQNSIIHQLSCVDTSSQNGVARKNRHLLETVKMQVPKPF